MNSVKITKGIKLIVELLVYLMPLHYYICEIFLKRSTIDNMWRDFLILLLFIVIISRKKLVLSLNQFWKCEFLFCFILIAFAIVSIITSGLSTSNILGTLRVYLLPIIWGYCISQLNFTSDFIKKLLRIFLYIMAIEGYYGFFQAFFLGDKFLVSLGYPSYGGYLYGSSYYINYFFGNQRAVGTFVSPNPFGQICAIALCVLLFTDININIKHRTVVSVGLFVGLISSFSRSSIVGFICAAIYIKLVRKTQTVIKHKGIFIFLFIFAFGALIIVDQGALNGLLSNMFFSLLHNTFSGQDLSANAHLEQLYKPLEEILSHPLGDGFGNHGPLASAYSSTSFGVESSFYLMGFEAGIFGIIFSLFPFIYIFMASAKSRFRQFFCLPTAIVLLVFIGFLLLPNVQTYEISFYLYLFIGFYFNKSIKDMIRSNLSSNL